MYDMTHSNKWHDSFICTTWLLHMCDMTPSHVWHGSFIRMTCLLHMCDMTPSYVWHDSFIWVTWLWKSLMCRLMWSLMWLLEICDVTRWSLWHDSFIYATWLIHMYDMTPSYMYVTSWYLRRDWLITVTWCVYACDWAHSHVGDDCHDFFIFICVTRRVHTFVVTHVLMWGMSQSNTWRGSIECYIYIYIDLTHVTHMKEACHIHEGVMSHISRSHVTHEWVMSRIHMCDFIYVWYDSSIKWATWFIQICIITHSYWRYSSRRYVLGGRYFKFFFLQFCRWISLPVMYIDIYLYI